MEIPSIYAPPTISTDFYTIPEQAIGKYVDTSIKNWQTNEDNLSKIDMALNSVKTFSELEEDKNTAIQPYRDAINQATNLAKTDPNSFLTQGGKLRNIGRQLVQDMTTGKIGQYSQAYEHFNNSLKENLENKNKNPNDVQEIFNSYKPAVIDALKKGESIPNVVVPNYVNVEKYLDTTISKMDPNLPSDVKEKLALRALNSNREWNEYQQHFPERNSPAIVGKTPDGKNVYIGYIKDKNGNPIMDENGDFITGRTLNEEDAFSKQSLVNQQLIKNIIGIRTPMEDDYNSDDLSGSSSGSSSIRPSGNAILTKGSPSEQSTLPIYTSARRNYYDKQLEEIDVKLEDPNLPPDVRATYEGRKKRLEEEYVDAKNRDSYLKEMTVEAMEVEASKNPNIDVSLIDKVPQIERQIKELIKDENIFSITDPESNRYKKEFSDLENQLRKAKKTNELYIAKYNSFNTKLSENQVNPTIGLNVVGNKDLQQTVLNILQIDPNSVTQVIYDNDGKPKKIPADEELNSIAFADLDETGYKFKNIKHGEDGEIIIEAINIDGKKSKFIVNNPDAIHILENKIDNNSFSPEVRNFVKGFSNPQITKVGREVESALNPVDGAYYGPLKEIVVGPIKAVIRKTSEGGIAMVTYDSRNNKRRVWRLSDNNGVVASAIINLASTSPMETSTNIMLEGESTNNTNNEIKDDPYFVDPEKVHIFNDTNIVNENNNNYISPDIINSLPINPNRNIQGAYPF